MLLHLLLVLGQEPVLCAQVAEQRVYVGQEFALKLELTVGEEFLARNMLQLFPVALELPVQLAVPWDAGFEPAEVQRVELESPAAPRLALGEELVRVSQSSLADARSSFVLEWRVTPRRSGALVLGPVHGQCAVATRFEEDFAHGRVPLDRSELALTAPALTLDVLALPEAGRPPTFAGAVGKFTIAAELAERRLRMGEAFELVVELDGPGSAATRPAPRFDRLAGFHRRAERREVAGTRARFRVELVPTAVVSELPAIEYVFFDPERESYAIARTPPFAVEVRAAGGQLAEPVQIPQIPQIQTDSHPSHSPEGFATRAGLLLLLAALGLSALLAVVLWLRRRSRA